MGIFTKKNKKKQQGTSSSTPEQHSPETDDDHETTDDQNVSLGALDYLNDGNPTPAPPVHPDNGSSTVDENDAADGTTPMGVIPGSIETYDDESSHTTADAASLANVAGQEGPDADASVLDVDDSQSSGPSGPHAETLLEILGLPSNSSWTEIRQTHQALMVDHDVSLDDDASRIALARAIRREMNTAYAALRLLAVD